MLDALIIILREALEASLIISALLAVSYFLHISRRWLLFGSGAGLAGAAVVAYFLDAISDWFEGAGQELLNAALLVLISLSLMCIGYLAVKDFRQGLSGKQPTASRGLLCIALISASGMAIVREGCEILIYLYSFAGSLETFLPVLIGGGIGFGIGASIGVLIYYLIINLPRKTMLPAILAVTTLIAAGMTSQAVQYLEQTGLVFARPPLWDARGWISETSLPGQLLYALIGYEATPTPLQIGVYLLTLCLMGFLVWLGMREPAGVRMVSK